MASFIGDGELQPSESTISVSSLLASCSLGSSSSSSQSLGSSIHYKDKLYDSASKALEAYIEDYEESLLSPAASTGKICIRSGCARSNTSFKPPSKQQVSRVPNARHGSFSSSSARRVASDPELASLTTDDLLGFASDGTLPNDQTYMPELECRKQNRWKGRSSLKKPVHFSQRASSLDRIMKADFYSTDVADWKIPTQRDTKKKHLLGAQNVTPLDFAPCTSRSMDWQHELVSLPSSNHYPRWLTSQKSDLDVSGITSIFDTGYPIWLQNYDLLSDSGSQTLSQTVKKNKESLFMPHKQFFLERMDLFNPIRKNGSSEDEIEVLSRIDQHASLFDPERFPLRSSSLSRQFKEPFKDDNIELLILKAERTLESSNKGFVAPVKKHCSPQTEDILEADRSWEKIPVTFKSPVPVFSKNDDGIQETSKISHVNDFLKDRLNKESQVQESTLSGGNHHGPVEALKQMLFNLQAVQQNFVYERSMEETEDLKKYSAETTSESKVIDQEMMPVNNSLQKALHHLSRLKELVEETGLKQSQESSSLGGKN